MIKTLLSTCFIISLTLPACRNQADMPVQAIPLIPTWLDNVDQEVHKLGSFNWVIVADPSFPALSRSGGPRIHLTREASAVVEDETPGINQFRAERDFVLNKRETITLTNNALNLLITDARKNYRILVIKTTTNLPYTSIFMELESGYWDGESETALRKRLNR